MANGCTDRTEDIVRDYARSHAFVTLVSLSLADKNNAWNHFIHEIVPALCPGCPVYFFMNGDARIAPGSLTVLAHALSREDRAYAAAAIPGSGRSRKRDASKLIKQREFVANLYALRGAFVAQLQTRHVRLPLGLEGDDGLLGALIKWDLEPRGVWNPERIVVCPEASFLFASFSITHPRDWLRYWKRLIRYGRRHFEFQLLARALKEKGLDGLTRDIRDLYAGAESLSVPFRGFHTVPLMLALRDMRREGRRKQTHPVSDGSSRGAQ